MCFKLVPLDGGVNHQGLGQIKEAKFQKGSSPLFALGQTSSILRTLLASHFSSATLVFIRRQAELAEHPGRRAIGTEVVGNFRGKKWSGRVDLNHRLHGPEPCALPS
jgi:hypothetical protein